MMSRWRASSPRHHKRHHKRQHKRQHKRHQRHHPSDPSDRGSRTPTATPDCRPPSQSHTLRGCQPAGSSGPHNESLGVRDIRSTAKNTRELVRRGGQCAMLGAIRLEEVA